MNLLSFLKQQQKDDRRNEQAAGKSL